jgi:hypothetical protein
MVCASVVKGRSAAGEVQGCERCRHRPACDQGKVWQQPYIIALRQQGDAMRQHSRDGKCQQASQIARSNAEYT